MRKFEYTVTDPEGLHARPAGALVRKAKQYVSRITVSANGRECDATRLMTLMAMCIRCGTLVTVSIEGDDEEVCEAEMKLFFEQNL